MNKASEAFSAQWIVPFADADPAGIVFFGQYAKYHHTVFERWIVERLNLDYAEWFLSGQIAVPLRSMQQEFLSPVQPGQTLSATLVLKKVGQSSITIGSEIFGPGPDQSRVLCARTETVHVFIDPKSGKKMNIPDSLRPLLVSHLAEE